MSKILYRYKYKNVLYTCCYDVFFSIFILNARNTLPKMNSKEFDIFKLYIHNSL